MMRVTTNGTLRTYRGHLARATLNQFQSMNTVLTQRRFSSYAESPSLATQSFRLHSAYARNTAQQNMSEEMISKYEAAGSSLQQLQNQYNDALEAAKRGQNDTNAGARQQLGETLKGIAEGMVQTLNAQYNEKFVFAGADGDNAPFELKDGKLYFRGLDVNDPANEAAFAEMAEETAFVDIGLGMQLDENEQVVPSTAFNSAISGIGLVGYGQTDGVPNNMISIISELGEIYSRADSETGDMSAADSERAEILFDSLQDSNSAFRAEWTKLDTKAQFLKTNDTRLVSTGDTLTTQYEGLDRVDLADALTTFAYAQYSYNAALRVGNDILSQSFIDYMS
ncbi:MAG TPA: hypothetical protein H9790_05850 [Candidatus Agathobaculum intestinipullorum]|nr:hypothetical protein [uncultured Agathobaculum sp.]HJA48834.1 hypothetical protein [Candidatus Agathobaculum intestinipullorum]